MMCRRRTCKTAKVVGELSRSSDPAVSEWGNPRLCKQSESRLLAGWGTWGTEISKYPEEKKSNEIS